MSPQGQLHMLLFTYVLALSNAQNENHLLQAGWVLCAQDDWRCDDSLFSLQEFFKVIVDLFETDADDPWCKDTLAWWDRYDNLPSHQ
jgi:hypothetical protein